VPDNIATRRRSLPAALALTALLALAPDALAVPLQVSMNDDYFAPPTAGVAQGRNVVWRNDGQDRHDTVSEQDFWASALLDTGQTYTRTFNAAGTFRYVCTEHSGMDGKIQVRPQVVASGRRFTITVSAVVAGSNFRHLVQVRRPGTSTWLTVNAGTTAHSVIYDGTAAGTYAFRAAYKRVSPLAQSNWSPARSLTVS
jgi:plastocyanin